MAIDAVHLRGVRRDGAVHGGGVGHGGAEEIGRAGEDAVLVRASPTNRVDKLPTRAPVVVPTVVAAKEPFTKMRMTDWLVPAATRQLMATWVQVLAAMFCTGVIAVRAVPALSVMRKRSAPLASRCK